MIGKGAYGAIYKVLSPDKGGCVRAIKVQIVEEDDETNTIEFEIGRTIAE